MSTHKVPPDLYPIGNAVGKRPSVATNQPTTSYYCHKPFAPQINANLVLWDDGNFHKEPELFKNLKAVNGMLAIMAPPSMPDKQGMYNLEILKNLEVSLQYGYPPTMLLRLQSCHRCSARELIRLVGIGDKATQVHLHPRV